MISATRYHDICCGHRVYGHESKCAHLHGHNYRIHFTLSPVIRGDGSGLDKVGRVLDFSNIKEAFCDWLEKEWDHKFLIWDQDPMGAKLKIVDKDSLVIVPFNPTAENMAKYLIDVGFSLLRSLGGDAWLDVFLSCVTIEETRKCSATYSITQEEYTRVNGAAYA